jgi:hypothetical protein
VQVGHDRHGAGVGTGCGVEGRAAVAVRGAAGWVGPVQRLIYRQQVGQVVAAGVLEVVDPLDAHRPLPGGLDGERGRVVEQQPPTAGRLDRPIAPHGRGWVRRRQDLLGELLHGDLVVVGWFAARHGDRRCPGHHRGDQQRRHVLRDVAGVEGPTRNCGHGLLRPAGLGGDVPGDRGGAGELEETASREHDPTPVGTAVARRESRSPRSKREHCSSVELGIEPGHGSAAFVHPHGDIASEVPVSRRGSNCCESPSRQAGFHERSESQSRLASQYSQHRGHSTGLLTSAREEQLNR